MTATGTTGGFGLARGRELIPIAHVNAGGGTGEQMLTRTGTHPARGADTRTRPRTAFAGAAAPPVERERTLSPAPAVGTAALAVEALLSRLGRRAGRGRPSSRAAARGGEPSASGRLVGGGPEEVRVLRDEEDLRGRVFERRAVRWFCDAETTGRGGRARPLPQRGRR